MWEQEKGKCEEELTDGESQRSLSRREFLKIAGVAGAAIGVGGGLGGFIAGCGEEETTTTAGAATTTAGATTTTAVASTTTVSAGPEIGPEVKIGVVTPKTGGSAAFGVPDGYNVDRVREWIGDGQVLGDNKMHPITLDVQDSQSDVARAGQVTNTLIGSGVQVVCTSSGSDGNNPVADLCEANETPCFGVDCPWQAYVFGRQGSMETAWKWTYLYFFGLEDVLANYVGVWTHFPSNMKMAALWPNDADGQAFAENFPPVIEGAGFTITNPGLYQPGTEDYTFEISEFKKAGCEVFTGTFVPPDFVNFWKQCKQQSFFPKIATVDKALLFPEAIEALGPPPIGVGLISGCWWGPKRPFKSYLTGETCQQWADEYEKRSGNQWTQPLMHVVGLEMAMWALQNATDPTDRESVVATVKDMKFDSIGGPIDFGEPVPAEVTVGVNHVHPNVYKSPFCAGQWQEGTKFMYDYWVVNNTAAPIIPLEAEQVIVPSAEA